MSCRLNLEGKHTFSSHKGSTERLRCMECGAKRLEYTYNMRTQRKMYACHGCGSWNDYYVLRLKDCTSKMFEAGSE